MNSLWRRWTARWVRKRTPPPLPIRERFRHFLALCEANDAFLRELAALIEERAGPRGGLVEVRSTFDRLVASLHRIVDALNSMSQGRYPDLAVRLKTLERDIAFEVFKERLIEAGAFIVWPHEPEAANPAVVGGKAAHLAVLKSARGLAIPPWFAITSFAYRHFMEASGLEEQAEAIRREPPGSEAFRRG